jgi:hypothetical protein
MLDAGTVPAVSTFTSESKAYSFIRATLVENSPATEARVEYWEDGLWRWFETMTKEDINR